MLKMGHFQTNYRDKNLYKIGKDYRLRYEDNDNGLRLVDVAI
jgi:hypothetical protein